jgi:hypothetical protein
MSRTGWGRETVTRRRPWLAAFTGVIAILAYAGAAALITGVIDFGDEVNARFPFGSTAFGGAALAVVVGVPMTVVTFLAMRPDSRTNLAAVVAGTLLVGWIAVEIGFVQSYSWLQPVFAFAGVAVAYAGLHDIRRT